MRTLDEIRQEMRDAASYYEYAKQAEVQSAMDRHEAVYGALAWVLEEPWKSTGEFDKSEDRKLLESFLERLKKATQPNRRVEETKRLLEELQFDMVKTLGDGQESTTPGVKVSMVQQHIYGHETAQVERTIWSDNSVTHRHRTRLGMMDNWSEWKDGKGDQ